MTADLEVTAMLTRLQGEYIKLCCLQCEGRARARDCHYRIKKWSLPIETSPDQKNGAHTALGVKSKIYLRPFHNKLSLIKIYVEEIDKFFRFIFYQYMVVFLFNILIYVFLL